MRAMVLTELGDVDGFELREVPDPEAGPGQVLVRVAASSVNPVDVKIRKGGGPIAPEPPNRGASRTSGRRERRSKRRSAADFASLGSGAQSSASTTERRTRCRGILVPADARQLARYTNYVNSSFARKIGRLVGWRERFWGRRYQAIIVSDEEEAHVERLR